MRPETGMASEPLSEFTLFSSSKLFQKQVQRTAPRKLLIQAVQEPQECSVALRNGSSSRDRAEEKTQAGDGLRVLLGTLLVFP